MKLSWDPEKRDRTLAERGLDFEDAAQVFAGTTVDFIDDRQDYGEDRWISFGRLKGRLVALVWTPRGEARHIISMRKANDREQKKYEGQLGP
jgi:uncharacterized DUF497 family protein